MKRGWAESIAIIERRVGRSRRSIDVQAPTLTEAQADAAIILRGRAEPYRMISTWHGESSPTRSIESSKDQSSWQRIDWYPTNPYPTWKPNRTDDIAEAIAHLR